MIDDAVSCTTDSCDEINDLVVHAADNAVCDNGQFCDGSETCDALLDCQLGTPPVIDDAVGCTDEVCNELTDSCDITPIDANCGDADACTSDVCDPLLDCQNEPIELCEVPVPASSDRGMAALVLFMLALGCLLLRRPAPYLR